MESLPVASNGTNEEGKINRKLEQDDKDAFIRADFRRDIKRLVDSLGSRQLQPEEKAEFMQKYFTVDILPVDTNKIFDKNTGEIDRKAIRSVVDELSKWDQYSTEEVKEWTNYKNKI